MIVQHRVVPFAEKNRTFFGVIAIAQYAEQFSPHALPVRYLRYCVYVFIENKVPVAYVFAENFIGFPTEESFR